MDVNSTVFPMITHNADLMHRTVNGILVEAPGQDLYQSLSHHFNKDTRWRQSVHTVFCQEYAPRDPDQTRDLLKRFASEHGFEPEDRTTKLNSVHTVCDVLKLYSVLVRMAILRPNVLFFVLPDVQVPASLSVVEGLYALRMALVVGDIDIFLRKAPKTHVTRTRRYDLCAFQADNIVLSSNQTWGELLRSLEDLVGECPMCLDQLTNVTCGLIVYPFKCHHAFHHDCIKQVMGADGEAACPTCREVHKAKGVVGAYVHCP